MNEDLNKRRCSRHPCTGAVELLRDGKLSGWGKVSEISRTGCYVETDHPLPIGTEVQLRLTMAGTVLEIGANVVWITPQVGMGMHFEVMHPEEADKLSSVIEAITATDHSPAVPQAAHPAPSSATIAITREAAPDILAKIIKYVNDKGVLTRQELMDIVKASK
jgi:Tfp pilus assembly protein PilZ